MRNRIKELRQQAGQHVAEARKIADAAGNSFSEEQRSQYDTHMDAFDGASEEIKELEIKLKSETEGRQRLADAEAFLAQPARRNVDLGASRSGRGEGNQDDEAKKEFEALQKRAFSKLLLSGTTRGMNETELRSLEHRSWERRALSAGSGTAGGYLTAPEQFASGLIAAVKDLVFVEKYATVFILNEASDLGAVSLDADPADPVWTSEVGTGDEDSSMAFGRRKLSPNPLAKRVKISRTLLRKSVFPVENTVRDRLAYKFARTKESAYMTGSGSNQPLGVFTASNDGISTGQDVSTGNTGTAVTFDGLLEAKWTLNEQHWMESRWAFHPTVLKTIAKIKNGMGEYIWREGVTRGEEDTLLGIPVDKSRLAPSTMTTGLYVGILACWKHYYIAVGLDLQIEVLDQLYAETNQNGYIGRDESDGMPVLESAFVRVKLG